MDLHRSVGFIWESPAPQIKMVPHGDSPGVKVLSPHTNPKVGSEIQIEELSPDWLVDRISSGNFDEYPKKDRLRAAALWYREAVFERKNAEEVAALSSGLVAMGAPLELLKASARAYLDDIEHARLCYTLSKVMLGEEKVHFKIRSPHTDEFDDFPATEEERVSSPLEVLAPPTTDFFKLARRSLVEGVLVQELASRFSLQLSRVRELHPVAAELLKKSLDERRQSDLHWDVFSWSLKKLGKDSAQRLWVIWTHLPKPRFEEALLGDGKMRDICREVKEELSERLLKYFDMEWKLNFAEMSQSERTLPISRPAS
jgi:hypothetical protein